MLVETVEIGLEFQTPEKALIWMLATAGEKRSIIPDSAQATADIRVWKNSQYEEIEQILAARTAKRHVPATTVKLRLTE
jgi:hypothetical protein